MTTETLAPDVGWEPSGHLSEVALSALADGEESLLDAAMHEHLGACDACAMKLGHVALRSANVASALSELQAHAEAKAKTIALAPLREKAAAAAAARDRRKIPVLAIAAAFMIAALGVAPSLVTAPAELEQSLGVLRKVAPSIIRLFPQALARAWNGPTGAPVLLVWALSVMLVAAGLGIAKRASKKAILDGGRR